MFSLFYGLWKYMFSKTEFHVLILGIEKSGKTVPGTGRFDSRAICVCNSQKNQAKCREGHLYREFYECDLDAGQHETMEPDFEVVKVLSELLDELNIELNHRKLMDGMLEICGVSSEKFRTVCSSIDKLDKQSFEQIKKELVEEKGLAIDTAEKIRSFVEKRGPPLKILSNLKGHGSQFLENAGSVTALQELEILFKALEKSKCIDKVVFDLSLARGLD